MAISATLIDVVTYPDGRVSVRFGDKTGMTFASSDELLVYAKSLEEDLDIAKKLLLGWWQARSPDLSNLNLVKGKTLTFDISSPNPIRVQ